MKQTISITIEHRVVASNRSYEQVKKSLEARLGVAGNLNELGQQLAAVKASWEQATQAIEKQLGTSGFSLFSTVDHGVLLSLAGKPRRVSQYAIGNPLLALQMVERLPEVALYAPLRLAVYEEVEGVGKVSLITIVDVVSPLKAESYPSLAHDQSGFARLSIVVTASVSGVWFTSSADARSRHGLL